MDWNWLKRKMEMDKAQDEFEEAVANLEQARRSWRETEVFSMPEHDVELLYIGTN